MKVGDLIEVKIWSERRRTQLGVGVVVGTRRGRDPINGAAWINWHLVSFPKNGVEKEFEEHSVAPLGNYWA
jgi:hypothetical protein